MKEEEEEEEEKVEEEEKKEKEKEKEKEEEEEEKEENDNEEGSRENSLEYSKRSVDDPGQLNSTPIPPQTVYVNRTPRKRLNAINRAIQTVLSRFDWNRRDDDDDDGADPGPSRKRVNSDEEEKQPEGAERKKIR
jgi:signal recognition particle GTPase